MTDPIVTITVGRYEITKNSVAIYGDNGRDSSIVFSRLVTPLAAAMFDEIVALRAQLAAAPSGLVAGADWTRMQRENETLRNCLMGIRKACILTTGDPSGVLSSIDLSAKRALDGGGEVAEERSEDGWIPWYGSYFCPVSGDTRVDIKVCGIVCLGRMARGVRWQSVNVYRVVSDPGATPTLESRLAKIEAALSDLVNRQDGKACA